MQTPGESPRRRKQWLPNAGISEIARAVALVEPWGGFTVALSGFTGPFCILHFAFAWGWLRVAPGRRLIKVYSVVALPIECVSLTQNA